MAALLFRFEDYFHALAEQHHRWVVRAVCGSLSNFFAFAGDLVRASVLKPRRF